MFRILVVDDEYPIREWLVYSIHASRPDFVVDSAGNGLEALEKCKEAAYDLVIADIMMPHMDGLSLLERLFETSPDVGCIVLSSYDDYRYVRSAFKYHAIDYLLKTEIDGEKLMASIDNFFSQRTKSQNISQFGAALKSALTASGTEENPSEQSEQWQSAYKQFMPKKPYFCFLVRTREENPDSSPFLPNIEKTLLRFFLPLTVDLFVGCVELTAEPSTLTLMQTQLIYLKRLRTENELSLLVYSDIVFEPGHLLTQLSLLYLNRKLDFYGIHYFRPENLKNTDELALSDCYEQVVGMLRGHRQDKILAQAEKFLAYAEKIHYPNTDRLKLLCLRLCEMAYLTGHQADLTAYHTYSQQLSPSFFTTRSITELGDLLKRSLSGAYGYSLTEGTSISPRILQVVSLIEEHYMDEISLSKVAEELHINAEYLSRSFKKQVGINFNSYLSNVRLQHAMDMLKSTDLRVADIAARTGFQNPAYFSRCFKDAFGLSPQQWKVSQGH